MKPTVTDIIDDCTPLEFGRRVEQRPRLFLTPERLAFLRTVIGTPPYDGFFARVKAFADQGLTWPLDLTRHTGDIRGYGCVLPHLALTFLLTGDQRYRDRVVAMTRAFSGGTTSLDWHLREGWAIAYDWLHGDLTPEGREEMATGLEASGRDAVQRMGSFSKWVYSVLTCNHLPVELGGVTATACALYGERPEISRWLRLCVEKARVMMQALGDDGASPEGIGYGQYYNEFMIKNLLLIQELMGVDLFADSAYFRNLTRFYLHSSLAPKAWTKEACLINFGDGVRSNWYGPDNHLRVLASVYRDPVAQWLADQHQAAGTGGNSTAFLNLTHYDASVTAQPPPDWPRSHHFADKDLVFMRSDWGDEAGFLAFKCGPHFGHHVLGRYTAEIGGGHMQADTGSIFLVAGGDYLLSGDGYFRKLTHYHNTYLINGKGVEGEGGEWFESLSFRQRPRGPRILAAGLNRDFEFAIGDLAPAYPESLGLRRAIRKVFYLRPRVWILADEFETAAPATLDALFHSDYEFQREGDSWLARGQTFTLRLTAAGIGSAAETTELQPFYYVDGKRLVRHYHLLKRRIESAGRTAQVTVLEVLDPRNDFPDAPRLAVEPGRIRIAMRSGSPSIQAVYRTGLESPEAIGLEFG